jgi:hypothetical protein
MEIQERLELLRRDYQELRRLEELNPFANYYVDDLIEEILRLERELNNLRFY